MKHAPTGLAILNSSGPERGSEGRVGRDEACLYGIGDVEFIRAERGSEGRVGRDESRPDGIGDVEFIRP